MPQIDPKDEKFLKKTRDRFKYCLTSWKKIREQHDLDMRFLAGESWEDKEFTRRKKKNIPIIHLDELTQYINQLVNDVRENKRAVKVLPKSSGATTATAATRSDWIRGVEYNSQAQTAYITALEGQTGGSYGFWKLETFYDSEDSFDLSARIVPVPDGNTIIYDPDCKNYDCSDAEDCFEIDFISHDSFKQRYPKARITDFSDEIRKVAPDWIRGKQVQIASYWKVENEDVTLHLVDIGDGQTKVMRSDQLPKNLDPKKILTKRESQDRRIVQYILNGVEVLETNDPKNGKGWPGKWIPIIPVFGKELFVDDGSGSERILLSLIRLARDPQRLLNYFAAQELMESKMTPRSPYMGPVGMFSNQAEQWESLNEEGRAWVEYSVPEGFQPGSVKPERTPFVPNFQQYEIAKEAARRHIMAAVGIAPLPTAAQRQNQKSGVALDKIEGERAQGSFHFIDNFDRSLEFSGRQLNDLFDRIHDAPRDIVLRKEDGTHTVGRVNDPNSAQNKEYKGQHDVVIITGPSHESQQEEAADFSDTLLTIPGVAPNILDLIVRMRNLGPIGEQIAARLTPPQFAQQEGAEPLPPTAQSAMNQMQQQVAQLQQVIAQLQQEKAAKMIEKSTALQQTALQERTKLVIAQMGLQRDAAESMLQAELQKIELILGNAHEVGMAHTQAELDRQNAEHANSLTPPVTSGNTPSGNGAQP